MALMMIVVAATATAMAMRAKHSSCFKSAMHSPLSAFFPFSPFLPLFSPSNPTDSLVVSGWSEELYFRGIRMTTGLPLRVIWRLGLHSPVGWRPHPSPPSPRGNGSGNACVVYLISFPSRKFSLPTAAI